MKKRTALTKKVRFEIFKRDGFVCQYCGATPPFVILQVDHINPVKNGGDNDSDNLITSCQPCNIGKGANLLNVVPVSLKQKASDIKEKEEQILGYNEILTKSRDRINNDTWDVCNTYLRSHCQPENTICKKKFASVKMFVEKCGLHECLDAVDIADLKGFSRPDQTFKYFCGVMWGKIRAKENF